MTSSASTHKRVPLSIPHMGGAEVKYVQEEFDSNWFSTSSPNIRELESELTSLVGLPALALVSGTAAIHLGLKLLNIEAGDEVIAPTFTFVASCNPVLYSGGTVTLMDCDRRSWGLDPNLLAEFLQKRSRINKLPKAVIVAHLFGQSADMDAIMEVCARYEVPVLEDAAEALGAQYKGRIAGTMGDIGAFSFNGNKIITGTTGGMLVAKDVAKVERARKWSTQSRDADPLGINNYVHSEIGYNYRMSNIVAAIVRGQLGVLELRVQQRRAVFERYRQAFQDVPGIEPQEEVLYGREAEGTNDSIQREDTSNSIGVSPERRSGVSRHTRWLSCFLIDDKEFGMGQRELIRFLEVQNIEARPVWRPMHTQPLYEKYECVGGDVAVDLNRRGICLPSSSCLSEEDQEYVIQTVRRANRGARG